MRTSNEINEIAQALAQAQGSFVAPPKTKTAKIPTKTGGKYEYNYADLAVVIETIKKTLSDNGLSVSQPTGFFDGKFVLYTRLMHKSGQFIEGMMPLPEGRTPQELGGLLTYYRRYSLSAITGVASDDDTDGGNEPTDEKPIAPPSVQPKQNAFTRCSQDQIKLVMVLLKQLGTPEEDAKVRFEQLTGKKSRTEWSSDDAKKVISSMQQALEAKKIQDKQTMEQTNA